MNEHRSKRLALARKFSAAHAAALARAEEVTQLVYLALYTDGGEKEITGTEAMPRQPMTRGFGIHPHGAHTPVGIQYAPWEGEYPVIVTHARLWTDPVGGRPARIKLPRFDDLLVDTPMVKFTHPVIIQPREAFAMPRWSGVSIIGMEAQHGSR